jgi:hypothetical protein
MSSIRIKAKDRKGNGRRKVLDEAQHGNWSAQDKSGKKFPEHWIQDVSAESNGKAVFTCRV